jgi:hypothetical protein
VGNENGTRLRRIALLCTKSAMLSAGESGDLQTANVLNKLSKSQQSKAKRALQEI